MTMPRYANTLVQNIVLPELKEGVEYSIRHFRNRFLFLMSSVILVFVFLFGFLFESATSINAVLGYAFGSLIFAFFMGFIINYLVGTKIHPYV